MRIIAATNKDLGELVGKGSFRQDLFYRINVVCPALPPPRQRKEDIPVLVEHFIGRMNRLSGWAVSGISQEALSLLMFHDCPGNIRELENIIEHAFVLCPQGELGVHCLPEKLNVGVRPTPSDLQSHPQTEMNAVLQSTQTQIILAALERNQYNRNGPRTEDA